MKRIILTETQYKRLIKKRLNEQEVVFKDPKDEYDITNEMMQLLIHLKFYVDTMANKSLYIDKVENGVIYIDSTKYTKEERDLINREIDIWINFTDITSDKRTKDLTYNFGIDSDWDDLHPNDDVVVVDDGGATDDVDLDNEGTTEIEYDITKKYSRSEYIALIKDIAISQMKKHKIPASITIAQGILESGDGNSGLARQGKNHFGIKCHSDWTGEKIYLDTKEVNRDGSKRTEKACFRKYDNISLSFDDHSKFLEKNSRYDSLFDLGTTDYKGWAEGLQRAGYATSPTYAKTLISIIEKYNLNNFDTKTTAPTVKCTLTSAELKYFNENIKNNEDNLNFRYWVNQDRKRLDKANKKLSDCGLEDPKLSKKGSINDNLRHSFVLLGKDWVNAGKPKRPEEVEVEVPEGEVPNNDAVNTYGFAVGSKFPDCVDQGKICYGGINGNWAGSMAKALEVASWLKVLNFNAGSQKRTRENTASGKRSDHWVKSIDSYGIDLPCGKSKGDNGYKKLREEFVKRGWITADEMPDKRLERGKGKWVNFNVGSYRYQVGWNVPDHYDHIHVGVRYRGKTKK